MERNGNIFAKIRVVALSDPCTALRTSNVRNPNLLNIRFNIPAAAVNPYCQIKCEDQLVDSSVVKNCSDASWDLATVFYRKNMKQPIIVQVWSCKLVDNTFLGQVSLEAPSGGGRRTVVLELRGRGKKKNERMPGKLTIEFQSEDDLKRL